MNDTVVSVLFLFRRKVMLIADKLHSVLQEKTDLKGLLGRVKQENSQFMSYYQRDNCYTPPGQFQSQIPSNLFGIPPPPSI